MQDPIVSPLVLQPKILNQKIIYLHYLFDSSQSSDFPKQFYKWWTTYYGNPVLPVHNVKIRLVANANSTLKRFVIHKKPQQEMLTKMKPTTTT